MLIQVKVSNKCGTGTASYTQETQASRPLMVAVTQAAATLVPEGI